MPLSRPNTSTTTNSRAMGTISTEDGTGRPRTSRKKRAAVPHVWRVG